MNANMMMLTRCKRRHSMSVDRSEIHPLFPCVHKIEKPRPIAKKSRNCVRETTR